MKPIRCALAKRRGALRFPLFPLAALTLLACSRQNNLLLGRVEDNVGGHIVVVTDCYRFEVDPPKRVENTSTGEPSYRFMPCRDADVRILGRELIVNGKSYGRIAPGDGIRIDHGVVSVEGAMARR